MDTELRPPKRCARSPSESEPASSSTTQQVPDLSSRRDGRRPGRETASPEGEVRIAQEPRPQLPGRFATSQLLRHYLRDLSCRQPRGRLEPRIPQPVYLQHFCLTLTHRISLPRPSLVSRVAGTSPQIRDHAHDGIPQRLTARLRTMRSGRPPAGRATSAKTVPRTPPKGISGCQAVWTRRPSLEAVLGAVWVEGVVSQLLPRDRSGAPVSASPTGQRTPSTLDS